MEKTILILALLTLVASSACGPSNISPIPTNIDGDWRITFTNGLGITCITVSNSAITSLDDACDGTNNAISNATPASRIGNRVILTVTLLTDSNAVINATYDLEDQGDGTFAGTANIFNPANNTTSDAPIVMVKQ